MQFLVVQYGYHNINKVFLCSILFNWYLCQVKIKSNYYYYLKYKRNINIIKMVNCNNYDDIQLFKPDDEVCIYCNINYDIFRVYYSSTVVFGDAYS